MKRALWLVFTTLLLAVGAWWVLRDDRPEARSTAESAAPRVDREQESVERPPASVAVLREALGGGEAVPQEQHEEPREDPDELDPPTPERPGPGQALLRVEAVALESGAPLAGVELRLFGADDEEEGRDWASSTQTDPARGVENDDVLTDSAGRGEFIVQADYAYELNGAGANGLSDEVDLELAPLREGEQRVVRLALPTAWNFEWHGRVIDGESERALVGVEVVACSARAERIEELVEIARARTVGDGRVVLRLPAWERWLVRCELPGFFSGGSLVQKAASSFETAQDVVLRRPAALSVSVLDPDGSPAEGIEVRVSVPPWGFIEDWHGEWARWSLLTGPDGRCAFSELPSAADVFVQLLRGERVLEWTEMAEKFQLQPGERRELEFRLPAGVALNGVVTDRERRPLGGVRLRLLTASIALERPLVAERLLGTWHSPEHMSGRQVASAITDEAGRFTIEEVAPGSWSIGPNEHEDLPSLLWPFVIRREESAPFVELVLDRGLTLEGTVLAPDGESRVRGAAVSCWGTGRLADIRLWGEYSDEEGRFRLGPLPAGTYIVQATSADDPLHAKSIEVEAVAGGPPVQVQMRWGGVLRILPTDPEGRPLQGDVNLLLLLLRSGSAYSSGWAGEEGEAFERLVPGTVRSGYMGDTCVRAHG